MLTSTQVLGAGPALSVGRIGKLAVTAQLETKRAVTSAGSRAMLDFISVFSGKAATPAQLKTCLSQLKSSLKTSPGYARAPLFFAGQGKVQVSVECYARPLADRSGYATGIMILPAGE